MNTVTVQLNDKQYDALHYLLEIARNEFTNQAQDDDLEDLLSVLTETKEYLWSSGCGRVNLTIPARHIEAIAVSGDNEPACRQAIEEDLYLRAQLEHDVNMGLARVYLSDAGIEGVNEKDDDDVRVVLLWIACHDISEESAVEV